MRTMIAVMAAALLLSATAAHAGVYRREVRQNIRIDRGICHGSLTRAEARALRAEQRNIVRIYDRAAADGVITRQEANQLARVAEPGRSAHLPAEPQRPRPVRERRAGPARIRLASRPSGTVARCGEPGPP